jgi:hypothetical protein
MYPNTIDTTSTARLIQDRQASLRKTYNSTRPWRRG